MPSKECATGIVKKLKEAGHVAYFAGGWVRDFLMRHPSDDIDIATSASVEQVQKIFPKTVPVGVAFGIIIVIEEGHSFEVATFRKDRGYVDGRRPSGIEPATPQEDAQRRDFTINGMFYDPLEDKIYDFVEGKKDVEKGVIRAIGNPHERFLEDRLRMMRAVRYSTRFNFPIESETLQAILIHSSSLLPAVAMERIWQEFKKMSQFAHFDTGLIMLHQLNLLQTIFPQLQKVSVEEIQNRCRIFEQLPKECPPLTQLLELFSDFSLEQLLLFCDYLKVSKAEREFAEFLLHTKNLLNMPDKWLSKLEPIEWARFYAQPESEICIKIFSSHLFPEEREKFLENHIRHRQLLEQAVLRIQSQTPLVRAEDLMREGIRPGALMGDLLREAERIAVNQNLEDRKIIISYLKKSSVWK